MIGRRARARLGLARQVANLEHVRATEFRDALQELTAALDAADRLRVSAARLTARELLEADRRRTQGVD